jgi:serine protease AprX
MFIFDLFQYLMNAVQQKSRILWVLAFGAGLIFLSGAVVFFLFGELTNPTARRILRQWSIRRVDHVAAGASVVDGDLRRLDLSTAQIIPTLRFNLRTRWPARERLPSGVSPLQLLTNAMNPGLGIRELQRQGLNGTGVSVAIIDYPLTVDHPEYASRLIAYHPIDGSKQASSMHGPAVASLLVGSRCGTAPGARLYYVATPDPGEGLPDILKALDWLLQTNACLPAKEKIRVVSISSSPDGERVRPRAPPAGPWPEARRRAEAAGIMVLDFARESAFIGPCEYDPDSPEDPSRCKPVLAKDWPDYFAGHLLVPVAPRATAEAYEPGAAGYQYCGLGGKTFRYHGVSWAAPYCAGVLAMGWQVRPDLTPSQMRALLFRSALTLASGEKVIRPQEFVRLALLEPRSQ